MTHSNIGGCQCKQFVLDGVCEHTATNIPVPPPPPESGSAEVEEWEARLLSEYEHGREAGIRAALEALPKESVDYTTEHPDAWVDCCGEGEKTGWNACRTAARTALEALLKEGKE